MGKFQVLRNSISRSCPWWIRRFVPETIFKHLYPKGIFTARYFGKPRFKMYSSGAQVENEIYWWGLENCHERLSVKIWITLCEVLSPKVVWDVGANTGSYGLLAKHFAPHSEVSLFEPLRDPIEIAQENFRINKFEGNFHRLALGNFGGEAKVFLESDLDFAYSVTVNKNLAPEKAKRELTIQVERASAFIENSEGVPNLIKIDVETFEPEVLEGFESMDLTSTTFLIEVLNDSIAEAIQKFLPPSDFMYLNVNDRKNTCRFQENLSKSDFYNFLIIPKRMDSKNLQQVKDFVAKYSE